MRAEARTIYFSARQQGGFHLQALRVIPPLLEQQLRARAPKSPPPAGESEGPVLPTMDEIEDWSEEEAWDQQFLTLTSSSFKDNLRSPDDQEDRFRLRLDAAQTQREVAAESLKLVQAELDTPAFVMSEAFLSRLSRAQHIYEAACAHEEKLEDAARRRLLEVPSGPGAAADIAARERVLAEHYGDLGPHYLILCRQLATLDYRLEMVNRSGRDVPTDELVKLNGSVLSTIGQLQKFTESSKSETLSKDRDALGLALLAVLEGVIAPSQPQLWAASVAAIKNKLMGLDDQRSILNTGSRSILSLVPTGTETSRVPDDAEG